MGGKDSIIVSADADFEAAVDAVVASAFGFSGQKCSACSRAIVEDAIYDAFIDRLRERVSALKVGDPVDNPNMGPVVSEGALRTIREYIEIGKQEGRVVAGGNLIDTPEKGYYVEPTVIADVAPDARISQEEIFGPVLAVIRARNFDHALEIANNTEFGLTGAIYSNDRDQARPRPQRIPRRQSLLQPQMHRRHGRRASLRRLQYVRNGFESRRPRLSLPLYPGKIGRGKTVLTALSCAGRNIVAVCIDTSLRES